ncbi:hypothetical protein C8T65DRAFT_205715 [Cerioporus squamosus]|nr:hypothetical protein C8T65DRAFT_205715 [Cerioporus squamosus]
MVLTFLCIALTLVGAAKAIPATIPTSDLTLGPPDIAESVPVVDIESLIAHRNVTLPEDGARGDTVDQIYPATLFLCGRGCSLDCTGYDLSTLPHNLCLDPGCQFGSAIINQPSNEGLPFGVFLGQGGCASSNQIPEVNTCYSLIHPAITIAWRDFEISP